MLLKILPEPCHNLPFMLSCLAFAIIQATPCPCATWHIEAETAPWLWPLLCLTGIACEIAAAVSGRRMLIWPGFALVGAGCLPERDLTLLVGNCLATIGLYLFLRK